MSIKYEIPEVSREHGREGNFYCFESSINLSQDFQTSVCLCYFGGKHSLKSASARFEQNCCGFWQPWFIPGASWELRLSSVQSGCCHHQLPARKWIIDVSNDYSCVNCLSDIVLLNSPPCPAWSCRPSPALQALPGSCSHGLAINRKTLASSLDHQVACQSPALLAKRIAQSLASTPIRSVLESVGHI